MGKTNTAENGKLEVEAGKTLIPFEVLTDSGDHIKFTSSATRFSDEAGYSPDIRPQGMITPAEGGVIPAVSTTNDLVDTVSITAMIDGVSTTVGASTDETCLRGAAADYRINSITITDAGAIAVVSGTENAAPSEVRAAAGGPPLIPVGSIEVCQVRLTSQVAAAVTADEIFMVIGQHQERWDYPVWDEDNIEAEMSFSTALPLSHTGAVPKEIWAKVYDPIFAEIPNVMDYVPPANSHTVDSTQIYNGTVGSASSSLGQGSFAAFMKDGITDLIVTLRDKVLMFRWYPDRNKTPFELSQGKLGISKANPAGDNIKASCTISATVAATPKAI